MTTSAANSPSAAATSTSSTDDSPRIDDNDDSSSNLVIPENVRQLNEEEQHNQRRPSSEDSQQQDESKKSDSSPVDSKQVDQTSRNSPDLTAADTNPTSNATTTISPTITSNTVPLSSSSSTSSSSLSTTPSSAMQVTKDGTADVKNDQSPPLQNQSHATNSIAEQKRPMNAFLLFCKRQRSLVREKHPNLENRGITKILGDWWTNLDKEQKSEYTDMARQQKEAFMKANPDFKWCKTPTTNNFNNNNSNATVGNTDNCTNNQNNEQKHQQNHRTQQHLHTPQRNQQQNNLLCHHNLNQNHQMESTKNVELLALESVHNHTDLLHNHSTTSVDMIVTNKQQSEAPKPPKKRFLERNDSDYITKDNGSSVRYDTSLHGPATVPCISLDQDILDRVIDKAFSEDSCSSKPSGTNNSCKCFNRNPTNLTVPLSNNSDPISFSPSTTAITTAATSASATTTSTSSLSSAYPMSVDEPVDFSMNRTINTTRQGLIDSLVEKMLSDDNKADSFYKLDKTSNSLKCYAGPPAKKDKSEGS